MNENNTRDFTPEAEYFQIPAKEIKLKIALGNKKVEKFLICIE
jgi:hypothetical protein